MGLKLGCTSPQEQGNEQPEGHGLIWLDVPNKNEGTMLQKKWANNGKHIQSRSICKVGMSVCYNSAHNVSPVSFTETRFSFSSHRHEPTWGDPKVGIQALALNAVNLW